MKKIIFLLTVLAGCFSMQAQGIDFGIKAGANYSNLTGDIDGDAIINFHAGGVVELNLVPTFSIQAEGLFSSQGAEYEDALGAARDFNLNYIAVPVLAKFYVVPEKFSVMAGPQFSFLVDEAEEALESKKFDLAASAGVELKIVAGLFAQARYNIGISNVSDEDNIDLKNSVFQLSVGYFF